VSRRAILAIFLVLQIGSGCGDSSVLPPEAGTRRDELVATVQEASPGDLIDLHEELGSDWDELGILPPYIANQEARQALGFDFNAEASPTYVQDSGSIIVLASDHHLVAWFVMRWDEVDMSSIEQPLVMASEDARLTVAVISGQRSLTQETPLP
jgi:hypothetical protein